jgi:hypothetical protein
MSILPILYVILLGCLCDDGLAGYAVYIFLFLLPVFINQELLNFLN